MTMGYGIHDDPVQVPRGHRAGCGSVHGEAHERVIVECTDPVVVRPGMSDVIVEHLERNGYLVVAKEPRGLDHRADGLPVVGPERAQRDRGLRSAHASDTSRRGKIGAVWRRRWSWVAASRIRRTSWP